MNTAPEDDDDETVSVKSFETCVMPLPQPQEEHVPAAVAPQPSGSVHDSDDSTGEPPEDQRVPAGHSHAIAPTEPDEKERAAAMLIQSAFRGFMVCHPSSLSSVVQLVQFTRKEETLFTQIYFTFVCRFLNLMLSCRRGESCRS